LPSAVFGPVLRRLFARFALIRAAEAGMSSSFAIEVNGSCSGR
jgi:hypothetical protein